MFEYAIIAQILQNMRAHATVRATPVPDRTAGRKLVRRRSHLDELLISTTYTVDASADGAIKQECLLRVNKKPYDTSLIEESINDSLSRIISTSEHAVSPVVMKGVDGYGTL